MANMPEDGYPVHAIACCSRMLSGQAWLDFREDVSANGVQVPVVLYEGWLIDGRQRQRAALETGRVLPTREWDGKGSMAIFVASLNLHRRHETIEDRQFYAEALMPFFKAEASARMKAGTLPSQEGRVGSAAQMAATAAGASLSGTERAHRVMEHGTPELQYMAKTGAIPLKRAAVLAGLTPEEQIQAIKDEGQEVMAADAQTSRADGLRALGKWLLKGGRVLKLLHHDEKARARFQARLDKLAADVAEGLPPL